MADYLPEEFDLSKEIDQPLPRNLFSTRVWNAFQNNDNYTTGSRKKVLTWRDLLGHTEETIILNVINFGRRSRNDVRDEVLAPRGLSFGMQLPPPASVGEDQIEDPDETTDRSLAMKIDRRSEVGRAVVRCILFATKATGAARDSIAVATLASAMLGVIFQNGVSEATQNAFQAPYSEEERELLAPKNY